MSTRIAETQGGTEITHWGATHRSKDGTLISRHAMVKSPEMPPCLALKCFGKYFKAQMIYILTLVYHQRRVEYAEKNRRQTIELKYRTGENTPVTFWGLVREILKIS